MAQTDTYIGIDGCRGGWLALMLSSDGAWRFQVEARLRDLSTTMHGAEITLVDMPLGLPDGDQSRRDCDARARALLGRPRASSVFTPPARPTLDARDYDEALVINRRCVGKGLSRQAWNLVPKIRELDRLRRADTELAGRLHESHPELCFQALNRGRPLSHNKKGKPGQAERIRILSRYQKNSRHIIDTVATQTLRKHVAMDDIADAMVLAISARLVASGGLVRLGQDDALDRHGIAMEIVYPRLAES